MAQCLLPAAGSLLHGRGSSTAHPVSLRPPTGEPDAGNPPVRFGGRGRLITSPYPYTVLTTGFAGHEFSSSPQPPRGRPRGTSPSDRDAFGARPRRCG